MSENLNRNVRVADRIRQDKYRIFNKELAHYIGLNESIYLAYLIDQDHYFNEDEIGKPFYKQQYYIYYETTLKDSVVTRLNKKFVEMGILKIVKQGLPAKNYFVINYEVLEKVLDESIDNFKKIKNQYLEEKQKSENVDTSSGNLQELEGVNYKDINNKESNNKDTSNSISKDISLEDNTKTVVQNLDNKFFKDIDDEIVNGNSSGIADDSASIPETPASPQKKKGGLAPLYDMVDDKYPSSKYNTLNAGLKTYLKAHLGRRRLPSVEKWEQMLKNLEEYSSVQLAGAVGNKFMESKALEIVQKAITGKDGIPYTEFDDIYHSTELKEPTFNLNRDFNKGY